MARDRGGTNVGPVAYQEPETTPGEQPVQASTPTDETVPEQIPNYDVEDRGTPDLPKGSRTRMPKNNPLMTHVEDALNSGNSKTIKLPPENTDERKKVISYVASAARYYGGKLKYRQDSKGIHFTVTPKEDGQ